VAGVRGGACGGPPDVLRRGASPGVLRADARATRARFPEQPRRGGPQGRAGRAPGAADAARQRQVPD
ncbi:unnamed protein product, partial [Prorocentrum cordatum]